MKMEKRKRRRRRVRRRMRRRRVELLQKESCTRIVIWCFSDVYYFFGLYFNSLLTYDIALDGICHNIMKTITATKLSVNT